MSSSRILAGAAAGLFVLTLGIAQAVAQVDKALDDEPTRKRLLDLGSDIPGKDRRGGPGLTTLVKSEIAKWTPVIKAAGPLN